jgi:hypothetical protein
MTKLQKRTKQKSLLFTPEELEILAYTARKMNKYTSVFIRESALEKALAINDIPGAQENITNALIALYNRELEEISEKIKELKNKKNPDIKRIQFFEKKAQIRREILEKISKKLETLIS